MLGMFHTAAAEMFEIPEEGGDAYIQNRDGLLFEVEDEDGGTVFNKELAAEISICHEQHCIRTRTAELSSAAARVANPIPPVLPAGTPRGDQDTRRQGASLAKKYSPIIPQHTAHVMQRGQCIENCQ
jgi:hypothetical protein